MKLNKKQIIQVVAGLLILISGYFLYDFLFFVSTDNAQVQARTLMMSFKVSGFLTKSHVEENQHVKAGDILLELDGRDYENTVNQMSGESESLEARYRDSERNYRRLSDLFEKGAVSQQQYDGVKTLYQELSHKRDAVRSQLEQAKLNHEYTKIKAPSDGIIAKKSVEVGVFVSPGVPVLGFVSTEERWIVANFKETDLRNIHVGHAVHIKVDSLSDRSFEGEVESVGAATGATFTLLPPDNATGNFTKVVQRVPVRIKFKNLTKDDILLLQAGLSVEVKVRK